MNFSIGLGNKPVCQLVKLTPNSHFSAALPSFSCVTCSFFFSSILFGPHLQCFVTQSFRKKIVTTTEESTKREASKEDDMKENNSFDS